MSDNYGNFVVQEAAESEPGEKGDLDFEDDPLLDALMAEFAFGDSELEELQLEVQEVQHRSTAPIPIIGINTGPITVPLAEKKEENARFKTYTEEELNVLEEHRQSASTKKNTKWGTNLFEAWCVESGLPVVDLHTVQPEELATLLRQFYASAAPKQTEQRLKTLPENQATEYHKNSMKSIRAALNRKIKDLGRDIDIVRDKEFKKSNNLLNAKLKYMVKSGTSRPTKHKPIITENDLVKISDYINGPPTPELLMYKVWYYLSIHFVSRGLEFHHQLMVNSFKFNVDGSGRRYVTLTHETQQKNMQGGLLDPEAAGDKRMYATCTDDQNCPVKTLETFLAHCEPTAPSLFCRPLRMPSSDIYYTCKPISKRMFVDFMGKICKNAGCSTVYTAHSLRATSIQMLSDAGVELRHIMLMSGHRNEASVRSYSRDCSEMQKRNMSDTLAGKYDSDTTRSMSDTVTEAGKISIDTQNRSHTPASKFVRETPGSATSLSPRENHVPHPPPVPVVTPSPSPTTEVSNMSYFGSSATSTVSASSSGFLNHCRFDNCQFAFSSKD